MAVYKVTLKNGTVFTVNASSQSDARQIIVQRLQGIRQAAARHAGTDKIPSYASDNARVSRVEREV